MTYNLINYYSHTPVERHHGDGSSYHHGFRGSSKGKGGSSAALSALTLLAFLFLINVMQQSLEDTNSTATPPTTAVLLRDSGLPIVLDNKEVKDVKTKNDFSHVASSQLDRLELENDKGLRATQKLIT